MAAGGKARKISIHAPREGGDGAGGCIAVFTSEFQSTPPARGATYGMRLYPIFVWISIHAPREGGDGDVVRILPSFKRFQSTPPARGATLNKRLKSIIFHISIHAPREGGDRLVHLHQIVTP